MLGELLNPPLCSLRARYNGFGPPPFFFFCAARAMCGISNQGVHQQTEQMATKLALIIRNLDKAAGPGPTTPPHPLAEQLA